MGRRIVRGIGHLMTLGLVISLLLGVFGYIFRDRSVLLGLLFYIPLLPIGVALVAWDVLRRGRSIPRARFAGTSLGVFATCLGALPMIGTGPDAAIPAGAPTIRVLHWNVMWGKDWPTTIQTILSQHPDIVILSEAPFTPKLTDLHEQLGADWSIDREGYVRDGYVVQSAVLSRWPVRHEEEVPLTDGVAMTFVVDRPDGPIRVCVADGQSNPLLPRTPRLTDLMNVCERLASEGHPADVIAGDFNTPGRSVGFDQFKDRAGGWTLASRSSHGWRATWPMPVPLYDIDHVWVSQRHRIARCDLVSAIMSTDHRGQVVDVVFAPE